MERKYIIGISNPNGSNPGLYSPYLGEFLIDIQLFGLFRSLCNTLALKDEKSIVLEVILSNQKGYYDGWIEMCRISEEEYKVTGLDTYKGEKLPMGQVCNPCISQYFFEKICNAFNPKYIYLKKTKNIHIKIPTIYNNIL